MRKGKGYASLIPYALAPDMAAYQGLPHRFTCDITLGIGNVGATFHTDVNDGFVEIIPGTWEVRYHGKGKAGVFNLDWTLKVFPSPNEPGVKILCGGILEDASIFLVEQQKVWNPADTFDIGRIFVQDPWRSIEALGVITQVINVELKAVLRKDVP